MIIRTALSLAVMAVSIPALAATTAVPKLASLDPVAVETRGALTTVSASAPVAAPAPVAASAPAATTTTITTVSATVPAAITLPAPAPAPVTAPAPAPAAAVVPDSLPAATPEPGTGKASDAIWRKIMLGTWQAVDEPTSTQINGEATFTPDGKAVGYTTATYVYGDGSTSDVKVALKFNWKIVNGIITLDQFESDPGGFVKNSLIRNFEIKSMNDTGAVFKDLADGQEVYRRRKPG